MSDNSQSMLRFLVSMLVATMVFISAFMPHIPLGWSIFLCLLGTLNLLVAVANGKIVLDFFKHIRRFFHG
jgi:hypothetical protein